MKIRERIARVLAPNLRSETEIQTLVSAEVARAVAALPITVTPNFDPKNEGYRPVTGSLYRRDLLAITQARMFEIAYFMHDSSAMTKRLAKMDKTFIFGEPITIKATDPDAQEIIDQFWQKNRMDLDFPDQIMWLGLLGEQCWPVDVNQYNGQVTLLYEDPATIKEVYTTRQNLKQQVQVEMLGYDQRTGRKMSIVREDENPYSKTLGKLIGDCFFWRVNAPPNSPRGRSDYLTLFDWIDGLERYGFNYLERAEFMLNFIWDVTLKGMNEDQIREWLRNNPVPEPGSMRAHNENATWAAITPDLKATDHKDGFEMGKSFIMGAAGRPDSWFGGGGKTYQTEADLLGQVPIKDLGERQLFAKHILENVIQFVLDQAAIAGRLSEEKRKASYFVNVPEMSIKDLSKMSTGVPQLVSSLAIAETNKWCSRDTATRLFAFFCSYLGYEIDAEVEIQDAETADATAGAEDYKKGPSGPIL